jgi:hypothetical protein
MTGNPKQHPNLKIFETDDGYVIYHRETDRVHFLNHTAVLVLELCNGRHSVGEMIAILGESYGLDAPPEKEATNIIDKFEKEGLITFNSGPNTTSSASR